ncbi:OmpH family outer membrane protein [Coraliomargarita akajimensis]|uniref:Outer membrane chaperone Skp (OmpH) n=1 Tax=Coraliomargarita akajimensis (strain DSM 45221 / IAM 15411 / JCM 23193 / KCTC 12865 / 04OKA010-24) TaxID=583355 RepID=D5EJK2_CORAD|nr:OmpH family outer membrane protein [Coraliomargarita akajimensis]ADE54601.1 outer membrane chaperone Skp (OmpH) [Coraliomargarita akajimensis DSM 45221]
MKKISFALVAALFVATGLFAQKSPVAGAVNMQRLLAGYTEYQTALEKYKGAITPAEEELAAAQKKLQEMQEQGKELETKKANPALSDDAKKAAEEEYQALAVQFQAAGKQFQAFQAQTQQLRNQSRQQFLLPLELKARETVSVVAKDKGIDLVFEIAPVEVKQDENTSFNVFRGAVLYADESLDITDSVIAILNAAE